MSFKPTAQQQAIIDFAGTGEDLVVQALAGTGKSTTLRLIAEAYPEKMFRYVVFNKSQEKEAKRKMPKNVESRTGNSLAWEFAASVYAKHGYSLPDRFNAINGAYLSSNKEIADHFRFKSYEVVKQIKVKGQTIELQETLTPSKVITHLKGVIAAFCNSIDSEIGIQHFKPEYSYPAEAVADARILWNDLQDIQGTVKLSHDHIVKLWAKNFRDLSVSLKNDVIKFDVLMIDEAQDTNPVFGGVYAKQTHMQRIYVGDQNQAIYGFRGAEDELQKVKIKTRLPLTESWRFGSGIADPANRFLEKLESEYKISGMRDEVGIVVPSGSMYLPNAVLCRTNAGALRAIYERLDVGQTVLVGASYKADLLSLLDSIAWFSGSLREKPKIHDDLQKYSSIEDIMDAIENYEETRKIAEIVSLFSEHGYDSVRNKLQSLDGRNRKDAIEIITAHRSKGSEWDRVQVYGDFWGYKTDPTTGEKIPPSREEFMLAYVAVTRAMKELDLGSLDYILKLEEN
jgi:superfamily I DNA/RNA helicase